VIGIPTVVFTWIAAYLVAVLLGAAILGLVGHASGDPLPPWLVLASSLALWLPQIGALVVVSRRFGNGNLWRDFGVRFTRRDAWGIPIGIASQLLLVNLVMWPLRLLFPERFSVEEVEKRARDLVNGTEGAWWLAIIFVVVFGAPLVEELVYRGFIQGSLERNIAPIAAVLLTAAWFTVVHLQPVEFPGLFAFALVLGWCRLKTGRIGMSIVAHVAFNVTGLTIVALMT
jgi:hypothetical protein